MIDHNRNSLAVSLPACTRFTVRYRRDRDAATVANRQKWKFLNNPTEIKIDTTHAHAHVYDASNVRNEYCIDRRRAREVKKKWSQNSNIGARVFHELLESIDGIQLMNATDWLILCFTLLDFYFFVDACVHARGMFIAAKHSQRYNGGICAI